MTKEYECYAFMAAAVVEQAVKDYKQALVVKHFFANVVIKPEDMPHHLIVAEKHFKSCERFFNHKELFGLYCDLDGQYVKKLLKQQVADYIVRNKKRQLTQEQWNNRFTSQEEVNRPKPPRSDYQHEQYLKRKAAEQARRELCELKDQMEY